VTAGAPRDTGGRWIDDAACEGKPTEWFFPEGVAHRGVRDVFAKGRLVCATCPVSSECLADAIESGEGFGLRGGLTPQERGTWRRKARLQVTS
jgi:WhiB family redox-sensing transcriptional regulator